MRAPTIALVLLLTGCGGGSDTDTSAQNRTTPPQRQEVNARGYAMRVVEAVDRSRESVRRLVGATGSWEAVMDEAERGASTMSRSVRDVQRLKPPGEVAQQHPAVAKAESLDSEALRAGARSTDMPELGSLR